MHITFLAYRLQHSRIMTTEFYRQDIEILRALGHEVTIATRLREVPRKTDLVFLWWWSWLWLVGPILKMRGLPICVTGSLEPDIYEKEPWYHRLLVRWGMRFSDRNVFVSKYMISKLSAMMRLVKPLYCPHIVMDEYKLANPKNSREFPELIFNVAWKNTPNMKRKMLPELIDAFAIVLREIPNAKLALAGEPMDGQAVLQRRAKDLGIFEAIDFMGKISKELKIQYMQKCGAYFQCSHHEGFGLAIAEAMACGAPVIVNRKTAIPEVVGEWGYYVENESPEAIAKSLIHALRDPEHAREVGKSAAARIDSEFRFDRRKNFFKELFHEMTQSGLLPSNLKTKRDANSSKAPLPQAVGRATSL